jgi:7,8-dihydropterin-6-yl-methyl-4-(beta-D-ribofuranosyl)aminobenzene 5'-phosphate synthase
VKISILNDNLASGICGAAHGMSWYIEAEKNILFDTGPSEIAFQNAAKLNIAPEDADFIVLSHGHWDHGNGLKNLHGGKLIAHPEIFRKRFKRSNGQSIGIDIPEDELHRKFDLTLTREPLQLTDSIWFLGEIPVKNAWDIGHSDFILNNGQIDTVPDDSGLVAKTNQGLVVISGCAHSGITNITLRAMELFPNTRVLAVMGGFHLKPGDSRIPQTIEFFKSIDVMQLYPSHCTAPEVICQMRSRLNAKFVRSGNVFKF